MVDMYGRWTEEKDYSTYPDAKWCDYDYMANWIRSTGYEIKTTMVNLIDMIFDFYENEEFENGSYFVIKDTRPYPDNLMVFIPDIEAYVEASGGLSEFDYYC